jgi:ribonuclease VapC
MRFILDTGAVMAFYKDEAGGAFVGKLISDAESGVNEGLVSAITVTELYYSLVRDRGEHEADIILEDLRQSRLKIVPMDGEIALQAGKYKLKPVPIADAIIAATAKVLNAKLVEDDEHFNGLGIELVNFRAKK